mmetsp:Transcript_6131/g.11241  ORF Transcript_6131/g.11241 Transcript_6131/m.11241 type:complete len:535 (+) Transcript_6131:529-2133(+)
MCQIELQYSRYLTIAFGTYSPSTDGSTRYNVSRDGEVDKKMPTDIWQPILNNVYSDNPDEVGLAGKQRLLMHVKKIGPEIVNLLQEVETSMWQTCHCEESVWHHAQKSDVANDAETFFFDLVYEPTDSSEPRGVPGTGNLAQLNEHLLGRIRWQLSKDDRLRQASLAVANTFSWKDQVLFKLLLHTQSQETLIDIWLQRRRANKWKTEKSKKAKVPSVRQERPGLRWSMLAALLLMWNSARPVAGALCKARSLTTNATRLVMNLHATADVTLVVATLILCTVASSANSVGAAIIKFSDYTQEILFSFLQSYAATGRAHSEHGRADLALSSVCSVVSQLAPSFGREMKLDVVPNVAISPWHLAGIGMGVLLFCLLSSATALLLVPREAGLRFHSMTNIGIVGPLCLCTEVANENAEFLAAAPALSLLLAQRSCLCTMLIILTWWNAETENTASWYAAVFNEDVDVGQMRRRVAWCGLVILHFGSGLAAVVQIRAASLRPQAGKEACTAHFHGSAAYSAGRPTGTHATYGALSFRA